MKKYTNKILVTIIGVLVISAICLPIGLVLLNYKVDQKSTDLTKETMLVTDKLDYHNFNQLLIKGAWQVHIKRGDFKIELNDKRYTNYIKQQDQQLELDNPHSIDGASPIVTVSLPELTKLSVSGAVEASLQGFNMQVANKLAIDLSGASELKVTDSVYAQLILNLAGASELKFKRCKLEQVKLNASGASDIELYSLVNGTLSGHVSGSTQISYSGQLLKNNLQTSGMVDIKQQDQ